MTLKHLSGRQATGDRPPTLRHVRQPDLPNTRQRAWHRLVLAPRLALTVVALAAGWPVASQAVDFGPFTLTGFGKVEFARGTNHCMDCQFLPLEAKDRYWADEIIQGKAYKTTETHVTLLQPYLSAKFNLPKGFKLSALLSQRWRDGKEDIPGFFYDKSVAVAHEDYGSLRAGAMTTRAWSVADYPYGSNVGLADMWGSAGAGYGLLSNAVRYTSRLIEVADGDLVLEATYDAGNTLFKRNKPQFLEFWAQYHKGDLFVDAMYQDTRNGTPAAWGHGPFTGLTPFAADDSKLGGSGQSIAMVMARYDINARFEISGGIRRNRWSGAYAVLTTPGVAGAPDQWNNMFNVCWSANNPGCVRGYAATTTDAYAGLRYRTGKWIASTGVGYLSKANTENPTERGQSNSAVINTLGLSYDLQPGVQFYGLAGMVHYGRLGLAPMSMPSNASFTNVDSRVSRVGNWFGVGAVYVF